MISTIKIIGFWVDFSFFGEYNEKRKGSLLKGGEEMKRLKNIDPTSGNLVSSMIWFALPVTLGVLLQTLFTACDLVILRMVSDSVAVASVGATTTVTTLFVTSATGIASGVNIVLARLIGGKEYDRAKRFVSTALISAVALGVIVAVIGLVWGDDILRLMHCPEDCFDGAVTYIIVYVLSAPFIMVYNFAAAIIRVNGDSVRPTFYLVYAGIANVALNLLLASVLEDKVLAVAFATVISQVLGAVLCVCRLMRSQDACNFSFRNLSFDFNLCKLLFRYGVPGAITNATFAISNLLIQGAINSFGSSVVAGNTASSNIENLVGSVTTGATTAISVFIGQNIGAGKPDRVRKTFRYGLLLTCSISFVLSMIAYLLRVPLLRVFVGDDVVALASGEARMKVIMLFYVVYAFRNVFKNSVGGYGYARLTMIESLISIVLFRIVWMSFIYPLRPTMEMAYATYFFSSLVGISISVTMYAIISYRYFKKGIITKI